MDVKVKLQPQPIHTPTPPNTNRRWTIKRFQAFLKIEKNDFGFPVALLIRRERRPDDYYQKREHCAADAR
jgi:hypothetical protein